MLLSQEARKENKLFTLKQLFDHLRQKEHRMSIFNVVIAVNRVQTDSYQPDLHQSGSYQSESLNPNHRGREGARGRGKTKGNSRGERGESQSNQNDDNHSLQNIECYQCEKKGHISRNCLEKKKDDSNFNTGNSEPRQNSNQNKRSNPNSMFVKYVDNSIEITHNQLSTQISNIA